MENMTKLNLFYAWTSCIFARFCWHFVIASTRWINGGFTPNIVEALSLQKVLKWVVDSQLLYSLRYMHKSCGLVPNLKTWISPLLACCLLIASTFWIRRRTFLFHWTRRHANRVGHELARASFQFDNFCIWHEPYSFILDALFVDSLLSNEVSSLFSK